MKIRNFRITLELFYIELIPGWNKEKWDYGYSYEFYWLGFWIRFERTV